MAHIERGQILLDLDKHRGDGEVADQRQPALLRKIEQRVPVFLASAAPTGLT